MELNEIAKELYYSAWIVPPNEWDELSSEDKCQWFAVATHVRKLLIDARVKELEHPRIPPTYVKNRIAELQAQKGDSTNEYE